MIFPFFRTIWEWKSVNTVMAFPFLWRSRVYLLRISFLTVKMAVYPSDRKEDTRWACQILSALSWNVKSFILRQLFGYQFLSQMFLIRPVVAFLPASKAIPNLSYRLRTLFRLYQIMAGFLCPGRRSIL